MLTLTYELIDNPDFQAAIRKIGECTEIKNVAIMLRLIKTYGACVAATKDMNNVKAKLASQYGTDNGDGTFKILNPEDFKKGIEELQKTEFQVDTDAFKYNDLLPAKPSAVDVIALGPIVIC